MRAVSSRGMALRTASDHSAHSSPCTPAGAAVRCTASSVYPVIASTDSGAAGQAGSRRTATLISTGPIAAPSSRWVSRSPR